MCIWDALAVTATRPGAHAGTITVVDDSDDPDGLGIWFAGEGTTSAACRRCRTRIDEDTSDASLVPWCNGGGEPVARCASCGWEAPLGDGDVTASVVVGNPAIVVDASAAIESPADLAERLRADAAAALCGCWAYVHHEL